MKMLLYLLLFICFFSCLSKGETINQQPQSRNIVVCFEEYNPQRYKTKGGFSHIPIPKVSYCDSLGNRINYTPQPDTDTIVLHPTNEYKELALSYRDFENIYYLLFPGDTITIRTDSLDYPILTSKHYPERNDLYNMNRALREGKTFSGLEAKTCLGNFNWIHIAKTIDKIKAMKWDNLIAEYCPVDSLKNMFNAYKQEYADTVASYKTRQLINNVMEKQFDFLLRLKEYESQRILNKDTAYYHQMEKEFSDSLVSHPSYHEFIEYYLWFYNLHIQRVKKEQGSHDNWPQTFDELYTKDFEPRTKRILLERCIQNIGEYFSVNDLRPRLNTYTNLTGDTTLYQEMNEKYNISTEANQMYLKDVTGKFCTFDELIKSYRGKVIYVDFWASWCHPCREEIPKSKKVWQKYKDKEVIFLYLAYKDTEEEWKKAIQEVGLKGVGSNYFITNSKNCKLLEKIKLELIPRYLIFDKQGNLVELNAPRPSSMVINSSIDRYLKN